MYKGKHIIFILFLFPLFTKAQDITGLWRGNLHNDSSGKDLRYELAISQEGKKMVGYSYTFFIYEDRVYQGLKKIKIKKVDDKFVIEDNDLVAHNYPVAPPKGTKQINALTLSIEDSVMRLIGPFKTQRTKEYSSVTGTIDVQRKNDFYKQSALMPHLQELGLANDLSFVKEEEEKQNTIVAIEKNKVESIVTVTEKVSALETISNKTIPQVQVAPPQDAMVISAIENTKTDIIKTEAQKANTKTEISTKTLPQLSVTTPQDAMVITPIENTKVEKEETINKESIKNQVKNNTNQSVVIKPLQIASNSTPAANINSRKIETIQSVYFKSDSLEITLYDNGEVDGDTVSVIMNGQVIMPKVGLSTNAVRKTISTKNVGDSIQLIMYAESLGSLPPNTGLLIVYDGKERYEIRFSGDMQKSSAIVFRRKQ